MAKRTKQRHPILSNKDLRQLEMAMQEIMPRMIWFNKQMAQFEKEQKRYNKIENFVFDRATDSRDVFTSQVSKGMLECFVNLSRIFQEVLIEFENSIDAVSDTDKKGVVLFELIHEKDKQDEAAVNIARLWELYAPVCQTITRLQERSKIISPLLDEAELLLRKEIN